MARPEARIGNPTGRNGANTTLSVAPTAAAIRPFEVRKCGTNMVMYAAVNPTSRP